VVDTERLLFKHDVSMVLIGLQYTQNGNSKSWRFEMKENSEAVVKSFNQMWGSYPEPVLLLNKKHVIVAVNKIAEDYGVEAGINCFSLYGSERVCEGCKASKMRREGRAQRNVSYNAQAGVLDGYWVPVEDSDGLYVHFGNNITEWASSELFPQIKEVGSANGTCS